MIIILKQGASEEENVVSKTVGEPTEFDFEPKNHAQIAEARGWLDKERAAKVTGARFAYLKGNLVLLQFAIIQFVMSKLTDQSFLDAVIAENNLQVSHKPFVPVLPPLNSGCFLPSPHAVRDVWQVYRLPPPTDLVIAFQHFII